MREETEDGSGALGGGRRQLGSPRPQGRGQVRRVSHCPSLPVPTRYGVVLGAVVGGVLGAVLLLLLLFYLVRYCWLRRQAALRRRLR